MSSKHNNILFYFGNEEFFMHKQISEDASKFFGPDTCDAHVERFSPDNSNEEDLRTDLCTSSLFSSKRFVVLSGFDGEFYEKLLANAGNIPDSTMLIITEQKIDKRTSFYKTVQSCAVIKEFKQFSEWDTDGLNTWIAESFKLRGKTIDKKTAELLVEICGSSLRRLDTEIEKICVYAINKGTVDSQDISDMASQGDMSTFAVENALANKDTAAMLAAVTKSLRSKERPEYIIAKLAGKIRLYLEIKLRQKTKMPNSAIISELKLNPYYYERLSAAAQKFSISELVDAIKAMHSTDLKLKTTGQSPNILMEMLCIDVSG